MSPPPTADVAGKPAISLASSVIEAGCPRQPVRRYESSVMFWMMNPTTRKVPAKLHLRRMGSIATFAKL